MITAETQITIYWKEFLLIFSIVCLIFATWNRYLFFLYKRILADFFAYKHTSLYSKAKKLQKHFTPSGILPLKKKEPYYHDICYISASLSLLSGNEEDFLKQISQIEGKTYALKSFTLALYYYAKCQDDYARNSYKAFSESSGATPAMVAMMDHLFKMGEGHLDAETLQAALSEFQNPTIVFLLKQAKTRPAKPAKNFKH